MSSELSKKHDLIGPADKISNLRRYHYYIPENESRIEREYRIMREWVHEYNHQYWTEQNLRFVEAKRAFVEAHKRQQRIKNEEIKEPTTAEYNEFYKRFLNENYYNHYDYNQKWLRYNFALLWPACKVFLYRLFVKNNRVNKRLKWEIIICLSFFVFYVI